jgi:hypothetical protein
MRPVKAILVSVGILLAAGIAYYAYNASKGNYASPSESGGLVAEVAEEFGSRLKNVSLLAPEKDVRQAIEENYKGLITPELLSSWEENPRTAPGRLVSSPWPEKIDVESVKETESGKYEIKGYVIETDSASQGSETSRRRIGLGMERRGSKWLIYSVMVGEPYLEYRNGEYGFSFSLPLSWRGYSVIRLEWKGIVLEGPGEELSGPLILIRHPNWSESAPRQDIPIMVFSISQWREVENEQLSVSAAPIPPSQLGKNGNYVFALPARYNFAFPEGFEEVEAIMKSNPLRAF